MDGEVKITNREWQAHDHKINVLVDDVAELKDARADHETRLRAMEDSMIQLPQVIQSSITEAVQPLSEDNRALNNQVAELKNEKYKFGYEILKWVVISIAGVVVTWLVGMVINNLWG